MQVGTIPNQVIATGQSATLEVSTYFRDPDGGALTYTAASSAAGVVSVSLSGSTLTMVGVADGTATVTVTARDPDGLTAAQGFQVTVETPNRAPEAVGTIPNQTVATGQAVTLTVSSYFRDPDGDALTYTAASSAAAVISVSLSGSTLTMVGVTDGTGTVTVTARDPEGLTAAQNFQVVVETPNRAPEAVGTIPNQTVATGGTATVDVSSNFRDPDGDRLTYTAASSNAAVATAAVSGSSVTISAVAAGTATVTVTAQDPDGLTAAQGFRVTVETANRAPEAVGTIPNQSVDAGSSRSVDVSSNFRDPDGDALTYTAVSSNAAVASVAVSGTRVTISGVTAGTATATVTARDPGGLTATQRFGVIVRGGGGGAGFRDDFDSSASLDDWEVRNASATVANGVLRLTRTSSTNFGVAEHPLEAPLTDWTIRARLGDSDGDDERVGVWWRTGNTQYPSVRLTLGMGVFQSANWVVAVWDAAQREWFTGRGLNGNSSAVRTGSGQFTSVAVGFEDGTLVVSAGDTELINARLPASLTPIFASVRSIRLVNQDSRGSTASFDWVEVTGDGGGGGGGDAPDLVVGVSPSNVTVAPGASFSYDVTVRNEGDGSSAATRVRHFESSNASISTNDNELSQTNVPPLGPSEEASGTITISVSAGATPGTTTYVGSCVDAVSGESDTGNNCSSAVTVSIETGGGGDACTVGLVLSPGESCTFSGGTFEVLSNGCVRVGSVSGICGGNININGLRATRLSGNRWEILALPSGDAGDGHSLTVTSAFDLTEISEMTDGAVSATVGTLEIKRQR